LFVDFPSKKKMPPVGGIEMHPAKQMKAIWRTENGLFKQGVATDCRRARLQRKGPVRLLFTAGIFKKGRRRLAQNTVSVHQKGPRCIFTQNLFIHRWSAVPSLMTVRIPSHFLPGMAIGHNFLN
jgi:hypothetical protein